MFLSIQNTSNESFVHEALQRVVIDSQRSSTSAAGKPAKSKVSRSSTISGKQPLAKTAKTRKPRSRNWTVLEREEFARILADVDDGYATTLEQMALKKTANTLLFNEIMDKLVERFNDEDFTNANKFFFEDTEYTPLDVSVERLRVQYNTMKRNWKKIHDEPLTKSGIAAREVSVF